MTKPIFEKDPSETRILTIKTMKHKVDKDALEITVQSLEGWFNLERYDNGIFVDKTMFEGKGLGNPTTIRFHIPKSMFPDGTNLTIKMTKIINPFINDIVTWIVSDPTTWV